MSTEVLNSALSAKQIVQCLREICVAATNYRIQTKRRRLRAFVISLKAGTLYIVIQCYKLIMYNTNTYLCKAYVQIPIITAIITDCWYARKSQAVTLCMYCYLFDDNNRGNREFSKNNKHNRENWQVVYQYSNI